MWPSDQTPSNSVTSNSSTTSPPRRRRGRPTSLVVTNPEHFESNRIRRFRANNRPPTPPPAPTIAPGPPPRDERLARMSAILVEMFGQPPFGGSDGPHAPGPGPRLIDVSRPRGGGIATGSQVQNVGPTVLPPIHVGSSMGNPNGHGFAVPPGTAVPPVAVPPGYPPGLPPLPPGHPPLPPVLPPLPPGVAHRLAFPPSQPDQFRQGGGDGDPASRLPVAGPSIGTGQGTDHGTLQTTNEHEPHNSREVDADDEIVFEDDSANNWDLGSVSSFGSNWQISLQNTAVAALAVADENQGGREEGSGEGSSRGGTGRGRGRGTPVASGGGRGTSTATSRGRGTSTTPGNGRGTVPGLGRGRDQMAQPPGGGVSLPGAWGQSNVEPWQRRDPAPTEVGTETPDARVNEDGAEDHEDDEEGREDV